MTPTVDLETHMVLNSVLLMRLAILFSFRNWFSIAIGMMQMESLQHASSVIKNSSLFSENMPMNLRSGVPCTSD
jgi:hypothetical protein